MNLLKKDLKRIKELMTLEYQVRDYLNFKKTDYNVQSKDITKNSEVTEDISIDYATGYNPNEYGGNLPKGDKNPQDYDYNDPEGKIDGMPTEAELGEEESTTDTGSSITPWSSGIGKGPGNKTATEKWESGIGKGPGNKTATEKWASGRTMGPTGKNYK